MRNYTVEQLHDVAPDEFQTELESLSQVRDYAMEGYADSRYQRDLSVRFRWGHNHDFGPFALEGQMGNRHLWLLSMFMDEFNALPRSLAGKRVLDIGVWTGGTSLLLHAMGAEIVAIEEVNKYARAVDYLRRSFALERLRVENRSLYECTSPEFQDAFDIVLFAGVLYHVSDPTIALRIAFNCLRDGGTCLIETYGLDAPGTLVKYEGPRLVGPGTAEDLNRGGWNWYRTSPQALGWMIEDVGFSDVRVSELQTDDRLLAVAGRTTHRDMLRAGLSQRSIR